MHTIFTLGLKDTQDGASLDIRVDTAEGIGVMFNGAICENASEALLLASKLYDKWQVVSYSVDIIDVETDVEFSEENYLYCLETVNESDSELIATAERMFGISIGEGGTLFKVKPEDINIAEEKVLRYAYTGAVYEVLMLNIAAMLNNTGLALMANDILDWLAMA